MEQYCNDDLSLLSNQMASERLSHRQAPAMQETTHGAKRSWAKSTTANNRSDLGPSEKTSGTTRVSKLQQGKFYDQTHRGNILWHRGRLTPFSAVKHHHHSHTCLQRVHDLANALRRQDDGPFPQAETRTL